MTDLDEIYAELPEKDRNNYQVGRIAFGRAADEWLNDQGLLFLDIVRFEKLQNDLSLEEALLRVHAKCQVREQIDRFCSVAERFQKQTAESTEDSSKE